MLYYITLQDVMDRGVSHMAVRSTMQTNLIPRVRILLNDPSGATQTFDDQTIQDVLDESRQDIYNMPLNAKITFSGNTPLYLDYETDLGGWEDGMVLRQFLTVIVTPATSEPIVGHWTFTQTTLPPVFISGHLFDVYRASADLLERMAARWTLAYNVTVDGQTLHREGALTQLLDLALHYRMKQRATSLAFTRSDLRAADTVGRVGLGATEIDYMGSG